MVNSEFDNHDPVKWAEAIKAICRKERKVRLKEAIFLRQYCAEIPMGRAMQHTCREDA